MNSRWLGFQFCRLALREKSAARLPLFETNYAERFKHLGARSARERSLYAFKSAPKFKQPAGRINESAMLAFSTTNHK
jgi:hypothetical protein